MKNIFAKCMRILTLPPLMAFALLTILHVSTPSLLPDTLSYLLSALFLAFFPILAYPLQPLLPAFRHKGREGQRTLALYMCNIGYILGLGSMLFLRFEKVLFILYVTYFLSGALLYVSNKILHVRSSGHACGVAGPVASLVYFYGVPGLYGLILYALTFWSSVTLKRHTVAEFVAGSLVSVISLLFTVGIAHLL